jgi:hypothetical protein
MEYFLLMSNSQLAGAPLVLVSLFHRGYFLMRTSPMLITNNARVRWEEVDMTVEKINFMTFSIP